MNNEQRIRGRYGRDGVNGRRIAHGRRCRIYRDEFPSCSCGLLHDLDNVETRLRERLYPQYDNDRALIRRWDARMRKIKDALAAERERGNIMRLKCRRWRMRAKIYHRRWKESQGGERP